MPAIARCCSTSASATTGPRRAASTCRPATIFRNRCMTISTHSTCAFTADPDAELRLGSVDVARRCSTRMPSSTAASSRRCSNSRRTSRSSSARSCSRACDAHSDKDFAGNPLRSATANALSTDAYVFVDGPRRTSSPAGAATTRTLRLAIRLSRRHAARAVGKAPHAPVRVSRRCAHPCVSRTATTARRRRRSARRAETTAGSSSCRSTCLSASGRRRRCSTSMWTTARTAGRGFRRERAVAEARSRFEGAHSTRRSR